MDFFEKYAALIGIGCFGLVIALFCVIAPSPAPESVAPASTAAEAEQHPASPPQVAVAEASASSPSAVASSSYIEGRAPASESYPPMSEQERELLEAELAEAAMLENEMRLAQETEILDESSFGIADAEIGDQAYYADVEQ